MKNSLFLLLLIFAFNGWVLAQPPKEPIYFLDNVQVNKDALKPLGKNDLATITVYKDTNAIRLFGEKGKDGVLSITTKAYAKKRYWEYFKSKSPEYANAVPTLDQEQKVVYILNDKVLSNNSEGLLFSINDALFISLKVINSEQLQSDYHISDKKFGIIIRAKEVKRTKI